MKTASFGSISSGTMRANIRTGFEHEAANREQAVSYLVRWVLPSASDWEDGTRALANHPTIGPWLRGAHGADAIDVATSIVREAEERMGDALPSGYSD